MKNKIVILVSMVGVLSAMAAPVLENDAMRILFADASRGWGVTGIVNKVAGDVRFLRDTTREIDLWQVFFAKEKDGKRVECKEVSNRSPAKRRIERDGNRTTFVFEGIDLPGEPGAVDVRATVELEPGVGGSLWTLDVTNRSRVFALTRTKYPVLKRVTDDGAGDVMMPSVNFGAFIQRKRDSKKVPDPPVMPTPRSRSKSPMRISFFVVSCRSPMFAWSMMPAHCMPSCVMFCWWYRTGCPDCSIRSYSALQSGSFRIA